MAHPDHQMNDVMDELDAIRRDDRAKEKAYLRTPRVNLGRINTGVPEVTVYQMMVNPAWFEEYVKGTELEDELEMFTGKVPGFEAESDEEQQPPSSSPVPGGDGDDFSE